MKSPLKIDKERATEIARLLHHAFSTTGIHGRNDMPADTLPVGVKRGSLEHLLFITLTVSINYQRDANVLWNVSRKTFEDPETRYLYDPEALHITRFDKVVGDMQKYGLSKKPRKDPSIWKTVGVTFYKKWEGDPRKFLGDSEWDALTILRRLKEDSHLYRGRSIPDYPFLRGNKLGPYWVRMLRDNTGINRITNLEKVPIPVDIHVARATLATGVVYGQFSGKLTELFGYIREAWFQGVQGLKLKNRPMIALDVDKPLWHLSKYGCTKRDQLTGDCPLFPACETKDFCTGGKIKIQGNYAELNT